MLLFILALSEHIKYFAHICLDGAKSPYMFKQYVEQEENIFYEYNYMWWVLSQRCALVVKQVNGTLYCTRRIQGVPCILRWR